MIIIAFIGMFRTWRVLHLSSYFLTSAYLFVTFVAIYIQARLSGRPKLTIFQRFLGVILVSFLIFSIFLFNELLAYNCILLYHYNFLSSFRTLANLAVECNEKLLEFISTRIFPIFTFLRFSFGEFLYNFSVEINKIAELLKTNAPRLVNALGNSKVQAGKWPLSKLVQLLFSKKSPYILAVGPGAATSNAPKLSELSTKNARRAFASGATKRQCPYPFHL